MIHMKVKPFLHVNHNVWFLFIVVFLNESRETAWEMYLPLLCHWGWKRRHEWTQDLYFCANNSKKWGPELVKRGPERTQDLYSGLYSEKGRSWVSEKRSRADSGPLFWTLQWKREVLSLWKELLRVSHFLKLLLQKPPLFLHHGEQCDHTDHPTVRHDTWNGQIKGYRVLHVPFPLDNFPHTSPHPAPSRAAQLNTVIGDIRRLFDKVSFSPTDDDMMTDQTLHCCSGTTTALNSLQPFTNYSIQVTF